MLRATTICITCVLLLGIFTTRAALPVLTQSSEEEQQLDLFSQPGRELDPRVQQQMTETPLPPLPHQIVIPKPAEHRIAAQASDVPISPEHWEKANAAIQRGITWLRAAQDENGTWMADIHTTPTDQPDRPSPIAVAVTALAVKAIVQANPQALERDQQIWRALQYIRSAQHDDGSFEGGELTNYVTASVVMGLAAIDDPRFQDNIRDAVAWLQSSQWDQGEGIRPEHDWFGGAGYGNRGRPDLSNTQMMLDALYDASMSPDEPAVQRAVAFLSRAQNLKATNPSEWAGNDGGFIYTPAGGGESFASQAAGEGRYGELIPAGQPRSLRSYGSMTYAGFKSMIYAGLSADDVRVRAAFDWIRNNWTFDENPGLGQQGLYYYYHTMARALNVAQQHVIDDIDNTSHNWREELIDALVKRQREDGSWINEADRWLEGHPVMATAYALLSLEEAIKPVVLLESLDAETDTPQQTQQKK